MDDVVSTFPLLRLPNKAVLNTLRILTLLQLLGISLLSTKTKYLMESLRLTARFFQVQVTDSFKVYLNIPNYSLLSIELYQVPGDQPLQELGTPANVRILHDREWVKWTNSMSVKQLLAHLQFVVHSSRASLFFKENCERFSLESIRKNIKEFKGIGFLSGNQEHIRRILNVFEPASITLFGQALVDFCVPRDILIQNFDMFYALGVEIAVDDLLLANSRFIYLQCRNLPAKIVNQFLKLWIKGSNPRLECFFFQYFGDMPLEELFSGLKHQKAPDGVRVFKLSGMKTPTEVSGGRIIWRFDGTQATIMASIRNGLVEFGMYVWHGHCVVN